MEVKVKGIDGSMLTVYQQPVSQPVCSKCKRELSAGCSLYIYVCLIV